MADEEVVMSIEETNRLRASLGLNPLSVGPSASAPKPKPKEEPKAADPEELRRKLAESRDKRRREAEIRSTQTLGAAAPDVDDVASWISKIKPGQQQDNKPQDKPQQQQRKRSRPAAGDGDGDEEQDGGGGYSAADLAGVAVRHDLSEMVEGETVVLTLADAGILDDKGNLADGPDQLENALAAQEKARRRARAAATKTAKPLWEEDGRVRGLLDKYDEEEEEAVAAFDAAGNLAQQQRRQAELHSKLAAGAAALFGDGDEPKPAAGGGDYYTAEEAAAAAAGGKDGKKKKKKRKLRTTKVSGEAEEAGGGLDLDALEAAAAAEGADDLGSRQAREQRRQQQEEARAAAAAERAARFEAALGRANIASEALRAAAPGAAAAAAAGAANGAAGAAAGGGDDLDEADDKLAASLARARRLANKAAAAAAGGGGGDGGSLEEVARRIAASREEDEQKLKEQLAAGTVEAFNETTEFVRAIQVKQELVKPEDEAGAAAAGGGSSYMDVDDLPPPPPPPPAAAAAAAAGASPLPPPPDAPPAAAAAAGQSKQRQQRQYRKGGWVTTEGEEQEDQVMQDADGDASEQQQPQQKQHAPELEDTGVVGERAMGKGLAACLGLIKEKGLLKDKTQWAGRTNDKKPVALIGLEDVYTGGSHEDAMSQRIEVALTQRDEFGRVMTPKERFRVMCHQFHGKPPSKNKQEERQRKYLEELAVARATTSDNPSAELDKLRELQRSTGAAFIPLTGRAKPGAAVRDPLADVGAGDASRIPATPMLGGGMTPLSGSRKVEMMLGISKPGAGAGSMPPPAPRR